MSLYVTKNQIVRKKKGKDDVVFVVLTASVGVNDKMKTKSSKLTVRLKDKPLKSETCLKVSKEKNGVGYVVKSLQHSSFPTLDFVDL